MLPKHELDRPATLRKMVRMAGFEPAAPSPPDWCSTGLSYTLINSGNRSMPTRYTRMITGLPLCNCLRFRLAVPQFLGGQAGALHVTLIELLAPSARGD